MSVAVERMKMGTAVRRLKNLADARDRFDIPAAELLPTQLERCRAGRYHVAPWLHWMADEDA